MIKFFTAFFICFTLIRAEGNFSETKILDFEISAEKSTNSVVLDAEILNNSFEISNVENNETAENFNEFNEKFWIIDDSKSVAKLRYKVALLLSENFVKNYTQSVKNAIFAYAISQNLDIDIRVYYFENESENSLNKLFWQIDNDENNLIIAPFSVEGAKFIDENANFSKFYYIPTLAKNFGGFGGNVIYGGIDYLSQIKELKKVAKKPIILINDDNYLGKILGDFFSDELEISQILNAQDGYYVLYSKLLKLPNKGTFVLNTVNEISASILKQIALAKKNGKILSTQLNFRPEIFANTTQKQRENLIIANSIDEINFNFNIYANFLGVDLNHDWIALSSVIGLDYFYSKFGNLKHKRIFSNEIKDSQLIYKTKLFSPKNGHFEEIKF